MSYMHTYTTGGVDADVMSSLTVAQQMLVTNSSKHPYMYILFIALKKLLDFSIFNAL